MPKIKFIPINVGDVSSYKNGVQYREKYPERYICYCLFRKAKLKTAKGFVLHHWSYQEKHATDVIQMPAKTHKTFHSLLTYDKETFMFRDLEGNLLDTKEKHLEFYNLASREFKAEV